MPHTFLGGLLSSIQISHSNGRDSSHLTSNYCLPRYIWDLVLESRYSDMGFKCLKQRLNHYSKCPPLNAILHFWLSCTANIYWAQLYIRYQIRPLTGEGGNLVCSKMIDGNSCFYFFSLGYPWCTAAKAYIRDLGSHLTLTVELTHPTPTAHRRM